MNQISESGGDTAPGESNAADMSKYGIIRKPVDYFHYKEYRYTNLKDAIAQAVRQQHSG